MKLTPITTQKEAQLPKELIFSLRSNNCIALVGSGLSKSSGYPSWQELIEELINQTNEISGSFDDNTLFLLSKKAKTQPEWIAEILKHESKMAYIKTLKNIFSETKSKEFSIAHALLAVLPFRGYLTTNYDSLIENYVSVFDKDTPGIYTPFEKTNIIPFIKSPNRFILKLHGCVQKDPGRLVLTSSDYFDLLRDIKYERILAYLFQRYSVLSLGFGLRDSDLRRFIEERRHLYGKECPPFYATVADETFCDVEIDAYKNIYNVHLIPISSKRNYKELNSLLYSIFCLIYSIDSVSLYYNIEDILKYRIIESQNITTEDEIKLPDEIEEALSLLSVFKDPIGLNLFTSLCSDYGLKNLTPAHLRIIGSINPKQSIITKKWKKPKDEQSKLPARKRTGVIPS